tara:strand:- start:1139 stop:3079 length:1941 start_codon:yes stop_codon:yes gene_type:complete
MSKNLLPAGLVPPSRTAEYDELIGKTIEPGAALLDKRLALVEKGIKTHKGLITQDHIKNLRAVDTGNPLEDKKIRQIMNKNRPDNLYDDAVISPLMQTLDTEGATDYDTDVALKNKMRGEEHKEWERNTMSGLDPSDPDYLKKIGVAVNEMHLGQISAPAVTAAATQAFTNTPIEILDKTFTDAFKAIGGDINNPKDFNTRTYNEVIKVAANNMAKNNPHIRNRATFIARAKELVGKHLKYGKKFSLRMKAEGSETYGSVEMDKYTDALSTSMGNMAGISIAAGNTQAEVTAASQAVTRDVNAAFKHMKKFDVSPEQIARIMPSIMQALATTDLIAGSGRRAGFGEARKVLEHIYNTEKKGSGPARLQAALAPSGEVTVGAQAKLQQAIRRMYQDRFKNNIPNEILNNQVDIVFNDDKLLSAAMTIGTQNAAAKSEYRAERVLSKQRSRLNQGRVLDRMLGENVEGTPLNVIYNDTLAKLKKDGWDGGKPEDRKKLQLQMQGVYRTVSGLFSRHNKSALFPEGNALTNEGREAFLLGIRRMFVNNVGIQEEGEIARAFGMLQDFSLTRLGKDMSGDDPLMILEKLYENLPLPDRSTESVADGLTTFKNKLENEIDILKKRAQNAFSNTANIAGAPTKLPNVPIPAN